MQVTEQQWLSLKEWLKGRVGESDYNAWLSHLKPDHDDDGSEHTVRVAVASKFMREWVVRHYSEILREGITKIVQRPVDVDYVIRSASDSMGEVTRAGKQKGAVQPTAATPTQAAQAAAAPSPIIEGLYKGNTLDPRYTFENFVESSSTRLAYAAAQRIAETDDLVYNPLFIHGGVGLGKTHLMHAIAHHILENWPNRRVLYVSSEKFVYQFIRSLKDHNTLDFKETFRSVDVLMIDDVQFIAGKDASQEEFFHTFNALVDMRKQIILTADRSPHEMDDLTDRLRSRLGSGLTAAIHLPDLETRIAIMHKKAEALNMELSDKLAYFLGENITTNIRELEGALNRLAAHATLIQQDITVDLAQDLLRDLLGRVNRVVTLDEVQKKVAEFYQIKIADMHSSRRSRNIARPRQVAMYLCKSLTVKSFPEIGRAFGGRDHTTVMHAVNKVEELIEKDPSIAEDVRLLEKTLSSA